MTHDILDGDLREYNLTKEYRKNRLETALCCYWYGVTGLKSVCIIPYCQLQQIIYEDMSDTYECGQHCIYNICEDEPCYAYLHTVVV